MAVNSDALTRVVAPIVAAAGLDLEGVEVRQAGRRSLVRVVVDADGGVSLDAVAAVSGPVSDALDECGILGDTPYTLEVTSPGVDRPLTEPRHWRRAAGRLVAVTRTDGSTVTGRVVAPDSEPDASADVFTIVLDVAGTPTTIDPAEVATARVQVEFGSGSGEKG